MKSKFLKATVLATAALAIGALASPTMAKTLRYTFGTASGGSYCDGVTITNGVGGSNLVWTGNHTGSCLNSANYAGAFTSKIGGNGYVNVSTTDVVDVPNAALTYLVQPGAGTWFLWINNGSGFTLWNEGMLIRGAPPAKAGAGSSVHLNAKAKSPIN